MRNSQTKELVLTALFTAIIVIMVFTNLGYIPLIVINATIVHIPVILGTLFCGPKKGAFLGFVFGLTSFLNATFRGTSLSSFVFSPVLAANIVGASGIWKSTWIAFVPRIMVGIIPFFVYVLVHKAVTAEKKEIWTAILNAAIAVFLLIGVRAFLIKMVEGISPIVALIVAVVIAAAVFALLLWVTKNKNANILAFSYAGVAGALTNTILVMGSIYVLYKDAYANALSVDASAVLGVILGVVSFNGVVEAIVAAVLVAALGSVLIMIQPVWGSKDK